MEGCKYCEEHHRERENQMTLITSLPCSKLYFYREQSYRGRCVLVYHEHIRKLTDLDDREYQGFTSDIRRVAKALEKVYHPDKINYLILGDECPHLHIHLVPKYHNARDFGKIFQMMPSEDQVFLSDDEEREEIERILKEINEVP